MYEYSIEFYSIEANFVSRQSQSSARFIKLHVSHHALSITQSGLEISMISLIVIKFSDCSNMIEPHGYIYYYETESLVTHHF